MRRREFIAGLGSAAAWPLAARAQQPAMPVVGFLGGGSPDTSAYLVASFRRGLGEGGFVEGGNVIIEYRWAHGQFNRVPALGAELTQQRLSVFVASGSVTSALVNVVSGVPMVAMFAGDPAKVGLVASLNRPGGNLTGVNMFAFSLGAKRFELLREIVSRTKTIAILINPTQPAPDAKADLQDVESAARAVDQKLWISGASTERDFEPSFAAMAQQGVGALLVMADPYFNNRREQIVALAARYAIPAIYEWREFAVAGGLMSYGSSITDAYRQLGLYTAKILNGEKPANLPIVQTVKVELVLNLKTAQALGLTFPLSLLGRADEVIE